MHNLHRACENCAAFNPPNRQGEPSCWNLVSFGGCEPTATNLCDDHLDAMENAMLDAVLEPLPFDDCGDTAESELADRLKALDDFKHRMFAARRTTAQALARARHD